ncbi:MAG: histidine phosphatase family protein [Pseudomonadota bacterium]
MKIVTLIRHAKSSWDYSQLTDFERPLNERGRRDAPLMAQRLKRAGLRPELLLSSPALRAISTARLFAEAFDVAAGKVAVESKLYDASPATILKVIQSLDDRYGEVWLFGHNPGISETAQRLAECPFDDVPTCACVRIELKAKLWSEISMDCGKLLFYSYPKQESD